MNLYTLFSFHPKEEYYFSVIDKQGSIFDKFQLPECREIPIRNNTIPIKEEFTDQYSLNLNDFLEEYDIYTCYTGGVGDLFSEKAVSALRKELWDEVEFIPCMLKGQPVPMYAALFLKTASIVKDFEGMGFIFEDQPFPDAKYAVQDENKGIKFVTQAFVDLIEKHHLKIECKLRT
ncbi:uncharacterized protein CHSO_2075 [Chryseobacterium sp. StRB126]|uniref:hypothetical protein n=1 Tax=Chryseobacterium sp. StRB126 TaxID=878220 RepID=UPI0004E98C69|nr:hypothetical protein [Chryseobacterium sp. StRB126]BAP31112.1 uncharacterized protein CHSO_2075 [Chryseobacterium sp. StRB126]